MDDHFLQCVLKSAHKTLSNYRSQCSGNYFYNVQFLIFTPPPPTSVSEALFSGRPFVSASVRACVSACGRAYILLAYCLTNQWTEFHQTVVTGVAEAITD